jgi:hypothetical protein
VEISDPGSLKPTVWWASSYASIRTCSQVYSIYI